MPHKSLREIRKDLRCRLSTDRYVDALLVVVDHAGAEVLRTGGRWDRLAHRYASRDCPAHVVRLQESQQEIGRGLARWLDLARRGEKKRPRLIVGGGNRGSGKTWILGGLLMVVIALEWPGDWQFGVSLTSIQRRECVEAIQEVGRPEWVTYQSEDLRDPFTEFVTGSRVGWLSAQNPKRLRQGKLRIRHILLNEGQDQAERNFYNAIGSIRNVGGLVTIATNPPQQGAGDWVATIWNAIEAEEVGHRGEVYRMHSRLNAAVDQVALTDAGILIRAVSRSAANADSGGEMKLSGPIAYPSFRSLPVAKGGHVGDPPRIGWRDVTRERTAEAMGGGNGFDWIVGVDFQRRPGIVGIACKLFLDEKAKLVIYGGDQVNCPGDESSFSSALERKGYTPQGVDADGKPAASALLVGDGTGARQNAAHNWSLPPSFTAMRAEGWTIIAPSRTRKGKPENPAVKESRAQMYGLFEGGQVLVSPRLKEADEGFASLVESLLRAKVTAKGSLVEAGAFQHAPDGLRYVCFKFGPRPQPPTIDTSFDRDAFDALSRVRLFST